MTTKDKVAMILSQRGFSLTEGMAMYDEMKADNEKAFVKVCPDEDCVVWLECGWSDGDEDTVHVMVWLNYIKDFCLSYTLAGAVALHDSDLNLYEDDAAKLMDFFTLCQQAYSMGKKLPDLSDDMSWIFTCAQLTDYMEADEYEVKDRTTVAVSVR